MKYFEIPSGKCTTDRQRKCYRNNTTGTTVSSLVSNTFADKRHLLILVAMTELRKEL